MTRFLDLVSAPELRRTNAEAVLRDLREAEGKLFRVTLSPPCSQMSVDLALLRQLMGDAFRA